MLAVEPEQVTFKIERHSMVLGIGLGATQQLCRGVVLAARDPQAVRGERARVDLEMLREPRKLLEPAVDRLGVDLVADPGAHR